MCRIYRHASSKDFLVSLLKKFVLREICFEPEKALIMNILIFSARKNLAQMSGTLNEAYNLEPLL